MGPTAVEEKVPSRSRTVTSVNGGSSEWLGSLWLNHLCTMAYLPCCGKTDPRLLLVHRMQFTSLGKI